MTVTESSDGEATAAPGGSSTADAGRTTTVTESSPAGETGSGTSSATERPTRTERNSAQPAQETGPSRSSTSTSSAARMTATGAAMRKSDGDWRVGLGGVMIAGLALV